MTKKYTIKDLSIELGISEQATRNKLKRLLPQVANRELRLNLQQVKENVGGYPTTVIHLDDHTLHYLKRTTKSFRTLPPEIPYTSPINNIDETRQQSLTNNAVIEQQQEQNLKDDSRVIKLIEELLTTKDKLVTYAEEVGKVKLLTANINQKEEDAKYYQEHYFRLKYENEALQTTLQQRENLIKELEEKLKNQKQYKKSLLFWK